MSGVSRAVPKVRRQDGVSARDRDPVSQPAVHDVAQIARCIGRQVPQPVGAGAVDRLVTLAL